MITRAVVLVVAAAAMSVQEDRSLVAKRLMSVTRASTWQLLSSVRVAFPTFHPQGMVKIGDALIVSSVDRAGTGHLFKMRLTGTLLADVTIGEGAMYYVDYQDCKYAGQRRMIGAGVAEMRQTPEATPFRLGGIDLVDLRDGRPIWWQRGEGERRTGPGEKGSDPTPLRFSALARRRE